MVLIFGDVALLQAQPESWPITYLMLRGMGHMVSNRVLEWGKANDFGKWHIPIALRYQVLARLNTLLKSKKYIVHLADYNFFFCRTCRVERNCQHRNVKRPLFGKCKPQVCHSLLYYLLNKKHVTSYRLLLNFVGSHILDVYWQNICSSSANQLHKL